MTKLMRILLISFLSLNGLIACAPVPKTIEDRIIEDLIVVFVPSRDAGSIIELTKPLKQILIDTLGEKGYTVRHVTIDVATDYDAAGEALATASAHVGFLPGGTYVAYAGEGVEVILAATRAGLSKDSMRALDWNDDLPTLADSNTKVTYYRALIYAGPSKYGRVLAEKVNDGIALTWEDVNGAQWCVSSSLSSSAGYVYPTMWLIENFNKKLSDLDKSPLAGGYGDIALNLAQKICDIGVGYADIRRDYESNWTNEWQRPESIWIETDVIGVTEPIFNDTISVSLNHPEMSVGFKGALQQTFIEIAQTQAGSNAIKIYNHAGYKIVTDADYNGARRAAQLVKG